MKKSKILSIVLGIALILVMALSLFACKEKCTSHVDENGDNKCDKCGAEIITNKENGNNDEDKDTYTFTLKDQNAGGVKGASVQVYVNGRAGDVKVTNAQGVVEFKVAKDVVLVQVKVTAIDDPVYRMNFDRTYTIDENGKSLVCNDVIKQDKFVITVIDTNGDAVVGARVQLCSGGTCKPPVTTNESGQATVYASGDNSDAYISFNSLPDGYALQNGGKYNDGLEEDYAHYTNFNSDKTIEIVVDKLSKTIVTVDGHFISATCADIQIDMYDKKTGALAASEITNAEGVAEFLLPQGDYYFKAYHKDNDPTYRWLRSFEGYQDVTSENEITYFVQSDEVEYVITANSDSSDLDFSGMGVRFLSRLYEEVATGYFDESGVATVSAPYDKYLVEVTGLKSNAYADIIEIEKNGVLNHSVNVVEGASVGSAYSTPKYLFYGRNSVQNLAVGRILQCKVMNPQNAILSIDKKVKVIIGNDEYTAQNGKVSANLGTEEEVSFTIEALEDIKDWSIEIIFMGSQYSPIEIAGNTIDTTGEEIVANLVNGKSYYTFIAPLNASTFTLSSSDNVKIFIDGMEQSSVAVEGGTVIPFFVVGEGNVSFNVAYQDKLVDYRVVVDKEGAIPEGIEVNLLYHNEVIATATTDKGGNALFEGVKEYADGYVKAVIADENIPSGYARFSDVADGATFSYEEGFGYATAYNLMLIRNGSQNAPYKWSSDGAGRMPLKIVAEIGEGATLYYDFLTMRTAETYYVYVMGDVSLFMYVNDGNGINIVSPLAMGAYDSAKNVTYMEVPVNQPVVIAVSSLTFSQATLTLRCSTVVPDFSAGIDYDNELGTQEEPFALTFGEEITTPDFVEQTDETLGIYEYYYAYTATADGTITVMTDSEDIAIELNDMGVYENTFTVTAGDRVVIIAYAPWDAEDGLAGVSFTAVIE